MLQPYRGIAHHMLLRFSLFFLSCFAEASGLVGEKGLSRLAADLRNRALR